MRDTQAKELTFEELQAKNPSFKLVNIEDKETAKGIINCNPNLTLRDKEGWCCIMVLNPTVWKMKSVMFVCKTNLVIKQN